MKALNRAIARTVLQIARHAGEGCHVPMIMALENHLDALLTMERKMLDGVQEVAGPDGQYWTPERIAMFNRWENNKPLPKSKDNAQPVPAVKLYGGVSSRQSSSYVVGGIGGAGSLSLPGGGSGSQSLPGGGAGILQPNANENAQPAPDVIDMADPANWQVGDVVVGKDRLMTSYGKEFIVAAIDGNEVSLSDGKGNVLRLFHARDYFKWLRHGKVQS